MRRDDAGRARWWLIPSLALLVDLAVIAFVQPHVPVRDEAVFYPAAQAFLRAGWLPSIEFLRNFYTDALYFFLVVLVVPARRRGCP
jgi:hypothetical protein